MNANQLVAYNLRRARRERHWTQEEAAQALEPYLGQRWSKAVFSAAETSSGYSDRGSPSKTERVREFSANEILAFAAAFDLPIAWFFVPPSEETIASEVELDGPASLSVEQVIDAIAPQPDAETDAIVDRLEEFYEEKPQYIPGADGRIVHRFETRARAALRTANAKLVREHFAAYKAAAREAISTPLARSEDRRKEDRSG